MKNSFFYTNAEIKQMKELIRTGKPLLQIARDEHANFGTTQNAFYTKLVKVARNTRKVKEWDGPKRVAKQPSVTETIMPEGFTFEGTPKKVTFGTGYFKVYF